MLYIESNLYFHRRGSAVFTADVMVDNSNFVSDSRETVSSKLLEDTKNALQERGDELMKIINTEGEGGIIGDPILDTESVQILDDNVGEIPYRFV